MYFYMPVKVFHERDCVLRHSEELAGLGSKALIVTGRHSSRRNGALADVEQALESQGRAYAVFDQIEENPSIETVMKARDFGLQEGTDYVIGVGGGSALDAAKAVALMMKNYGRDAELLYSGEQAEACRVAAVPTTCGTGSEVTPYAILTIHERRTKSSIYHKIFPELALIDGKYLSAADAGIIANTAVDALGHLIESFCNRRAGAYSRMLCSYGLEVWAGSKEVILAERKGNIEDFDNLMCASAIAGMAITHTGTSLPHGMSYKITYEKGIPHGKAVGIFQAAYLKNAAEEEQQMILGKLGMTCCEELQQFIARAVGTVQLEEVFLQEAVEEMLSNARKLANCPYEVDRRRMEELYRRSCRIL